MIDVVERGETSVKEIYDNEEVFGGCHRGHEASI